MSSNLEPRWLRRPDQPLPFVVTICTVAAGGAVGAIDGLRGDFKIHDKKQLAPNASDLFIECRPQPAWSLFCELRESLPDADVFVQPRDERGKRLLICDMDMTIVAAETLDEVAGTLGMGEQVAAITERAMRGEVDFNAALRARIAMLAGRHEQIFYDVAARLEMNPGAGELIDGARAAGVHTILISGGFIQVAEAVGRQLGFDEVHCNRLELEQGRLTGGVVEPIINADLKRRVLQERAQALGIALDDCCAIGDGANDIPMIEAAGLGIAYHGKPVLRAATPCQINATDLASALHFMGLDSNGGD